MIDFSASLRDRATLASPQAPAGLGHAESIPSAESMRDLTNKLGAYYGREPIGAVEPIDVQPAMLNPRAWPPCKHCGGNVHCENYDPDTAAELWESAAIAKGESK